MSFRIIKKKKKHFYLDSGFNRLLLICKTVSEINKRKSRDILVNIRKKSFLIIIIKQKYI